MSVAEWRSLTRSAFINKEHKSEPDTITNSTINKGKGFQITEKKRNELLDLINRDNLKRKK